MRRTSFIAFAACALTGCATGDLLEGSGYDAAWSIVDAGFEASWGSGSGGASSGSGGAVTSSGGAASGGAPSAAGGKRGGSGGARDAGDGGKTGSGGKAQGSGGSASGGTSGSGGGCGAGEKLCKGSCVNPGPGNGCGAPECDPCQDPPEHGFSRCVESQCGFGCLQGYVLNDNGSACQSEGGGTGGSGAGGGGGTCVESQCPNCFISGIGGIACCKNATTCGCKAILGLFPCG